MISKPFRPASISSCLRCSVRRRAISSGEMFASMRSIYEGARPLRPLALALKILSTMLRVSPRGRPSHSAETRRLARHFALWVRVAYDRSSCSTREGP